MRPVPRSLPAGWAASFATLALLFAAPSALAQRCSQALTEAETLYVEGSFGTVIERLAPCLDDTPDSVPARRLIVLALLRLGQITDARLALLDIFEIRPSYQPDAVRDPPVYQSFVRAVQGQLAEGETEPSPVPPPPADQAPSAANAPPPAEPPPPVVTDPEPLPLPEETAGVPRSSEAPSKSAPPLVTRYWFGAGSYGGERGVQASGPIGEFADNAGAAFGIGIEGVLHPRLRVFGDLEAGYYPTLPTDRGENAVFDPIDADRFSNWVRFATAGVRLTALEHRGVALYGALGGGIASGDNGAGAALSGGVGADLAFSRAAGAFVEANWTFVTPARAIDAAARPSAAGDLFSAFRFGLQYRIDLE